MLERTKGTFPFSANFEVKVAGKLDAREYCSSYGQLLQFTEDDYLPPGFTTTVWDENPTLRGIYQLLNAAELENPESWKKLGNDDNIPPNLLSLLAAKADLVGGKVPASQLPALGITRTYPTYPDMIADTSLEGVTFGLVIDASGDTTLPPGTEGVVMYANTDEGWIVFDVEGLTLDGMRNPDPITADIPLGGFAAGEIFNANQTWPEFAAKLLGKTFYPIMSAPTYNLSHGGFAYRKIGETLDLSLNFNYNPGAILGALIGGAWSADALQGNRSGAVTGYIFRNAAGAQLGPSQLSSLKTIDDYVVLAGANTFRAEAAFGAGPQPKDSKGNDYLSPFPAGNTPEQVTSWEGVYPFFASTVDNGIATETELPLMTNVNAGVFEIELAPDGAQRQRIVFPALLITNGRNVNKIEYFNTVSNTFDTSNKISDFVLSDTTKIVSSLTIDYKRLTYNGPARGALRVRVYYS